MIVVVVVVVVVGSGGSSSGGGGGGGGNGDFNLHHTWFAIARDCFRNFSSTSGGR